MAEQRELRSESYGEVISELDKTRQRRQKEQRQKDFDKRVVQLADKAIEFAQKRGQDDGLTVLLVNFLDVALQMKNLMETMSAINVAMECLSDAIGFLDAAIDFDNYLMDESLMHNYSLFQRWKQKRKMRKTIKNNYGRMVAISNGLAMKYKMATDMMKSLSTVGEKLKKVVSKTASKKAKQSQKTGKPVEQTAAQAFLAERMKANGVAPTAEVSSSSSDDSGIDDIL